MTTGAPSAERRPTTFDAFGEARVDDYYWLRDSDDPATVQYLEAENRHTETFMAPLEPLRQELYDAIGERVQQTADTPPAALRGYEYFARTQEGADYPDSIRRPRGGGPDQVLLDRNAMAVDHEYFACFGPVVSPSDALGLYVTDHEGSESYTVRVRDFATGADLPDTAEGSSGATCWLTDDTFVYVVLDDAHRPYQVRRHTLGDNSVDDVVLYEEQDERFHVGVLRSLTGRFVFIRSQSTTSTEEWFVPTDRPASSPVLLQPREDGLEYATTDDGERFLIVTNADGASDFKVVAALPSAPSKDAWTDVLNPRDGVRIHDVSAYATFYAVLEVSDGLWNIRIVDRASGDEHVIEQSEAVYDVTPGGNLEFDTSTFRYRFESLNVPGAWIDYDVAKRRRSVIQQTEVLGGFDSADYVTAREWAKADDGTLIPISVFHHRNVDRNGTAPGLLVGYGAYEESYEPTFSVARLNFADRGLVWAIAHVRGGGEMGRRWYEDGRLRRKRNTFDDFIACARHLVDSGWVASDRLGIRGGSAGGLLVGAVLNAAPQLFKAAVAEVPFVDAVTTLSDETIPLTVTEWDEWGNPRDDEEDYHYIRSYSPVDNVAAQDYPAMYVTAGYNDPRVPYWEAAKWVATLRSRKTDGNPLLLKTDMGAGHGGATGRYKAWDEEAQVQAFLISQL